METRCPLRVMVVDDQNSACRLITELVSKLLPDTEVAAFSDPHAALEWADQNHPALSIIDYRMPYLDGQQFVKQLRANAGPVAKSTVVIVTAIDDDSIDDHVRAAGANHVIRKPVDPEAFSALLREVREACSG